MGSTKERGSTCNMAVNCLVPCSQNAFKAFVGMQASIKSMQNSRFTAVDLTSTVRRACTASYFLLPSSTHSNIIETFFHLHQVLSSFLNLTFHGATVRVQPGQLVRDSLLQHWCIAYRITQKLRHLSHVATPKTIFFGYARLLWNHHRHGHHPWCGS